MDEKPRIFISAVTKELRDQRKVVANALRFLGCEPVLEDEFAAEHGEIRTLLGKLMQPCRALIQLVGHARGADVKGVTRISDIMSYTQFEAEFATEHGKTVWYILIDDGWKIPFTDPDGKALPQEHEDPIIEQRAYRSRLKKAAQLYHTVADDKELEICILKMLPHLDTLRPQRTPWLHPGDDASRPAEKAPAQSADVKAQMREVLEEYLQRLPAARQQSSSTGQAAAEEALIAELAKRRDEDPAELRRKLSQKTADVQEDKTEPLLLRAEAAFASKDYLEAERLALAAAEKAQNTQPIDPAKIIRALEIAGWSAIERRTDAQALAHFESATSHTKKTRDPLEWARVHHGLAYTLYHRGDYARAEAITREILSIRHAILGPEHPDTLASRNILATTLRAQGNYLEAEKEHREVLALTQRILGSEHPNTLASRSNLAQALHFQGRHAEAEQENREVLALRQRVLGPEHRNTLSTRNNLADTLDAQGKHTEAEREHREVLALRQRILGPEHPETLASRSNLAEALRNLGKYQEAEADLRQVIPDMQRIFGEKHLWTLETQRRLAHTLELKGETQEAKQLAKQVLDSQREALGLEHPETRETEELYARLTKEK